MFRKLEISELGRVSPELSLQTEKLPFVFVLDGIRSLMNVGSIFRTADAFRVSKLYLCGFTGTPPHREIQKTALGATESVVWEYFESIEVCLKHLKSEGFGIWAIEQTTHSLSLEKMQFQTGSKYAFILGNEVSGVSEEALGHCEGVVEIPQFGSKHSLNVAVTTGIVAWEFVKQRLVFS
jgi:tRNA G18 (ribose-2'-O)-methylase SpoU